MRFLPKRDILNEYFGKIHNSKMISVVPQRPQKEGKGYIMFILLAGGLLVIIIAVIVAVVSSVSAAVAADQDVED